MPIVLLRALDEMNVVRGGNPATAAFVNSRIGAGNPLRSHCTRKILSRIGAVFAPMIHVSSSPRGLI